jgi:hypothetical protein
MREVNKFWQRSAYIFVLIGFIAGIASFVRIGSIAIAAGASLIAIANWKTGKVERYLALGLALALMAVAISLPRGL